MLPIRNIDAAFPVFDDFVVLFPIFCAAANILLGKDDEFEKYLEHFYVWQDRLHEPHSFTTTDKFFPDEVNAAEKFVEGAVKRISVNAYERDSKARKKCVDYYGTDCFVCGFNFEKVFGELGKGFIHVHHIRPISEIAEDHEIDPLKDLIPVCPNCHAMIHRLSPPFSLEEMKELLNSSED